MLILMSYIGTALFALNAKSIKFIALPKIEMEEWTAKPFWQSLLAGLLLLGYVYLRGRRLAMTWPIGSLAGASAR